MSETAKRQETFFRLVFGKTSGYVCIAHRDTGPMYENFFQYPEELPEMLEHVGRFSITHNVYFCPQVLSAKRRVKENVAICPTIWADLDGCPPDRVLIPPSVVTETSPGRYQALWVLERPIDPEAAEDIARRIAYNHASDGADRSGWDLTQLLRVPLSRNLKYEEHGFPLVKITEANRARYRPEDFLSKYSQVKTLEFLDEPMPDLTRLDARDILEEYKKDLNPTVWSLFYETPTEDWSKALWSLELALFESGLEKEEVFAVVQQAACNKYARDSKPVEYLWKEILKAHAQVRSTTEATFQTPQGLKLELLTDEERRLVQKNPSVVERYVEWAKTLGDAAWQYHQAGAFVILSTLTASAVRLPTSYGIVVPNLWFLILADTTLTRKTTAMDIAMDLVLEIDSDCVLATDGSIEGLMTSLATRPGRASVFLRDEFSGLLEQMTKRDYYAGMAETLTKLYDGKFQKRVLRKEIIEVKDPILVLFAGGIRTRIYELLDYQHVASGFLPRFVFIAADSDVTRLKPLGPPTERNLGERAELLNLFRELYNFYEAPTKIKVNNKVVETKRRWDARLTDDAWVRYNRIESDMVTSALDTERADLLTPTMDRLAKSGLKMSVLLAASRMEEEIVVTEEDLIRAFYYVEQWAVHTIDLLSNLGKTSSERTLERIYRNVRKHPGVSRSTLMQNHHLSAREADALFATLEQRGLVRRNKHGKSEYLEPVEIRT